MKVTAWYAGLLIGMSGGHLHRVKHTDDVLIQFNSPDDEHCVLETGREVKK
jgi:hypothetical protein